LIVPRIEIDVAKISENAKFLVDVAKKKNVSVTAVTKAFAGRPDVARALVDSGVSALGDSRIGNLERLRTGGVPSQFVMIRSPMLSQASRIVRSARCSFNTEMKTIERLAQCAEAMGVVHEVILMVELGDLREGFMPEEIDDCLARIRDLASISFRGIGTNLACRSGVIPDTGKMNELSHLADRIEFDHSTPVEVVSGGNSANLEWLLSPAPVGRVNNLRLGESILLGTEPLYRKVVEGLTGDAFVIVGEVIESRRKPTQPWGNLAQSAFPRSTSPEVSGSKWQTIVALGRQDTDPEGLTMPSGMSLLGASSDHLVLGTCDHQAIGSEIRFIPDYSALLRSMTSVGMYQMPCS
jgi:predicted amino acid racemase